MNDTSILEKQNIVLEYYEIQWLQQWIAYWNCSIEEFHGHESEIRKTKKKVRYMKERERERKRKKKDKMNS